MMSHNPRSQNDHGRNDRDNDRSSSDSRRHNIANPKRYSGEEDVERGKGNENGNSRSSILSSIDYDRNAE